MNQGEGVHNGRLAEDELCRILAAHAEWLDTVGAQGEPANLAGANLAGANLAGANLERANLERANLSGANLFMATAAQARVSAAQLDNARLEKTDFAGADLNETDLRASNLRGAALTGTVQWKGHEGARAARFPVRLAGQVDAAPPPHLVHEPSHVRFERLEGGPRKAPLRLRAAWPRPVRTQSCRPCPG